MTGRLQLIEQKLIAIDSAGFQNLCDVYLVLRENEHSSFNRTGSQLGKQKTIFGTPDSFIRLADNKLAYIEYTTQADSIVSKIKSDIDKCLDSDKTGVEKSQIYQIVICFNSRLTLEEETKIQSYATENSIRLMLIGIDTLAIEIMSKYLILSRDFLGIPIDTGQILPFDSFIKEYNHKASQLSTPLDNVFLHRVKELEDILSHLQTEDLLILSGAPGVGKTRIGIEAINKFIESNPSFQSFVISKKDVDISDDLRIQVKTDRDYILLIDDANRQLSNLFQILGIFKEIRQGKLKIVITVRNYAYSDIYKAAIDFKSYPIFLEKFTDPEIIKIIESDSFEILNPVFQRKIVEIADGNVRLAIMGARLAKEIQGEFLWKDISDLFDSYFNQFSADFDLFEHKTLLKTLALISFFFTINRENKAFIYGLLDLFGIDYYEFNEAIEELHRRELIEVQYNHARISEQVIATYFFYKVFIKDDLLSFKKLLFNYFPEWKSRFKDSITPALNLFKYENIISKIDLPLNEYLSLNSESEEKILDFLDLFWLYKPEDTISYFFDKTAILPEPLKPVYSTFYENNDFNYNSNNTIDFITRFFYHLPEWQTPAILLGFEYIRKKPENLPEFIKRIRENLMFDEPDERNGFQRQRNFIDLLISNAKSNKPHYLSSFFALAKTFLQHSYHHGHGGRNHTFTWYNYNLPCNEITKNLRAMIWQFLFDTYKEYPEEVFEVIKNFKPSHQDLVPDIMDYDLTLLLPFIETNFTPSNFKQTYFIHDMIYWLDREDELKNRNYRELKSTYATKEYLDFCKLDWNKLRDKNEFDFDFKNFREYDILKTEEIKKHFTFSSEDQFEKFLKTIDNVLSVKVDNDFAVGISIDIVIKSNFENNKELGFTLLVCVLNNYPSRLSFLSGTVNLIISSSKEWCSKLWNIIEKWDNSNCLYWKLNFFNFIKDEYIDEFYCEKLIETIQSIDNCVSINLENYFRYGKIRNNIFVEILEIIIYKIDNQNCKIVFSYDIFEKNIDIFPDNYQLLKILYFQQLKINNSPIFDFKSRGFEKIFIKYPQFMIDYLKEFVSSRNLNERTKDVNLKFVWKYDGYEEIITKASDILLENNYYTGIGDHEISILFKDLEPSEREKAFGFILEKIKAHISDYKRISIYFDTMRNCFNEKFEECLLFYLRLNPDINIFEKIDWVGNVGVISGEVNFGDLYAKKWEKILEIVNKSEDALAMIPIKSFLNKKIANQYKWAESERERKFLTPDW